MRLFISTLSKLRGRLATWLTLGLLILLLTLIYLAVGATAKQAAVQPNGRAVLELLTFPGAYALILSFILGLGGLFVMAYAAAIGLLIAFAVGVIVTFVAAKLAGVSTDGITETTILGNLPEQFARGWLGLVEVGALGFTIATLARSQLAGVGAGIGIYFAESFAGLFLPDVIKYLPFKAATAIIATNASVGGGQAPTRLDPNTALVVVLIWLVGSLVVTAVFTERAEISG